MNNILVVGGLGYIGRHFKQVFPDMIYTDRSHFDLNNIHEIENFCKNIKIDICIILSAKISYDKNINFDEEPFKTNLGGLNNLLITLKNKSKDIKIIYFSSMTVYSNDNSSPVSEESNLLPLHSYGLSKVFAEQLIKYYDLKSVVIRIPGVYGGDRKAGFIYNTIFKLKNNEDIIIDTEDLGYWETIHIFDLITIFKEFLSKYKFNTRNEVFNLAYGEETDFIKTVEFLKSKLNSKSSITINKKYKDFYLSNQKISDYLPEKLSYFNSLEKYLYNISKLNDKVENV